MNQNNSLYETDYEDLFGHPYPQVISFEEVRGFFIDELHHNVVMTKDSGLFTPRSEKKYYQGRLDAIQDIFMKIYIFYFTINITLYHINQIIETHISSSTIF